MKRIQVLLAAILVLCFSSVFAFIPMPLDSPVVIGYTAAGLSTGLSQGRGTARDSHGWVYAVYLSGDSDMVRCSRSTNDGQNWLVFANLYPKYGLFPNIVIDRGDSIYVDWERQPVDTIGHDIYFSKYNGVFWTPPVNVSNEHGTGSNESSSLALDGRGMLHLTWLGYGPDIWYTYYMNNVWSTKENVTRGAGSWVASMCADTASNLHLAWQGWQIMYKARSGGVWGPTEQTCPTRGWQPCIVTDSQCRPQIVYSDTFGIISYVIRDSSGWSTPYLVSDTLGSGSNGGPSITCDNYGRLYVVWEGPETFGKLWYASYDGTSWSPPVRLRNDTTYGDFAPRLGFPVSDSGIDLIWTTNNPSGSGYRVMYWRLPLLPVGAEAERLVSPGGEGFRLSVQSPVRRELRVSYALPTRGEVSLALYDISGRKIVTLEQDDRPAAEKETRYPLALPSGVYFLRLEAGKASLTRKFVLLR
jgi:hypothetical protein